MNQVYDRDLLEGALSQMESDALNFAHRFIKDGMVRMRYINQTKNWLKNTEQVLFLVQFLQRMQPNKSRPSETKSLKPNVYEQVTLAKQWLLS